MASNRPHYTLRDLEELVREKKEELAFSIGEHLDLHWPPTWDLRPWEIDWLLRAYPVGVDEGLKHESSIHCDELVSLPKAALTDFVGSLSAEKLVKLNQAIRFALGLTEPLEK